MSWSYKLLAFLVLFIFEVVAGENKCKGSRCGENGPPIRFPFGLKGSNDRCGFPGFELSCNGTHTVIEFPESVNFFVSKINYKSREIDVYDPNNCLVGQLLKIHGFSNSPFYYVNRKTQDYSFFNCSSTSEDSRYISCLSGPDYQILGVQSYKRIYNLPLNCTRMYDTPMPTTMYYNISSYNDKNNLRLNWLEPTCGHCEANGRIEIPPKYRPTVISLTK